MQAEGRCELLHLQLATRRPDRDPGKLPTPPIRVDVKSVQGRKPKRGLASYSSMVTTEKGRDDRGRAQGGARRDSTPENDGILREKEKWESQSPAFPSPAAGPVAVPNLFSGLLFCCPALPSLPLPSRITPSHRIRVGLCCVAVLVSRCVSSLSLSLSVCVFQCSVLCFVFFLSSFISQFHIFTELS